jgi:hypothetical protein
MVSLAPLCLFLSFFFFWFLFFLTCRPCPVGQREQCHFGGRAPVCQPAAVRETRPYVFFPCQALLALPGQRCGLRDAASNESMEWLLAPERRGRGVLLCGPLF